MKCEKCKQEHDGSYGSGRFCCSKCARSFATFLKRCEINKKVSDALRGISTTGRPTIYEERVCGWCKEKFQALARKKVRFCSVKCSAAWQGQDLKKKQKISDTMKLKVANGTHSGWKSRNGKLPSYAEKFFMNVLDNNHLSYERDCPAGRWFIDFALKEKMVALEIDGKQHEYADRKESDKKKDKFLVDNGWRVYRIKWKSINNEKGKQYISEEIKKFLNFIGA